MKDLHNRRPRRGQRIAIANQKGGSGKSTTAVLLAKAFEDAHRTVTLIDCDPQGGATSLFRGSATPGLYDALTGTDLEDCIHRVSESLSLIPADSRLSRLFVTADIEALTELSANVDADHIVYDTAPTLDGLTRAAITAADRIWIPSEVSETAFGPTRYTIEQVAALGKRPEVLLSGWKRPDRLKGTARKLSEKYEEAFGSYLIGTLPRTASAAKMATSDGRWSKRMRELVEQPLLLLSGGAS